MTVKYEKIGYISRHLLNLRDLVITFRELVIWTNLEVLKEHVGIIEILDSVKTHVTKRVLGNPSKASQIGVVKFISESIATFIKELTGVRQERSSV